MNIHVEMPVISSLPESFVPFIELWRSDTGGSVSAVHLDEPTPQDWQDLGGRLTERLTVSAHAMGLCVIGQCGVYPQLAWTKSLVDSNSLSRVSLFYQAYKHPRVDRFNMVYMTWLAFQSKPWADFLPSIWGELGPNRLHYGCDALLVTYSEAEMSLVDQQTPPSIDEFSNSLQKAQGWLAPMGDNLGFTIGLPPGVDVLEIVGRG